MKKNRIYIDNLSLLGRHLQRGKLFHPYTPPKLTGDEVPIIDLPGMDLIAFFKFTFREILDLFPDSFEPSQYGIVLKNTRLDEKDSLAEFFGLDEPLMVLHLFAPFCQSPELYGGVRLDFDATPQQIGDNIIAFLNNQTK